MVCRPGHRARSGAAAIAAAASEDAGLVWIEGEAGAGKTALVAKVTAELAAAGSVLRMAADEHTEDRPFWVTQQVGVTALTGPSPPVWRCSDRFEQIEGPSRRWSWSRTCTGPIGGLAWRCSPRRSGLSGMPWCMLVTSRPDARPDDGWGRFCVDNSRCRRLVLSGLTAEDVVQMGRQEGMSLTTRAAERLHAHTGGHALYVRTLLREVPEARLTLA